ncbi:hypothetical protein AQUCO_00100631v1 [Aquilegia coerulea]|uniref:RecQ mediated genome instability protein 1 OB-fold domain-containing protein n=1 Tax=Aquilegia coerulea TaxID=218851 RepID=A0A2G5FB85_AQUCA|nr:hypothetical protein AQUCO_00100631v1 [Aquilegia coerulea]PIA65281.1 hypothetical protein AQUCO_00100631v1 [Aquilegia coerulea]
METREAEGTTTGYIETLIRKGWCFKDIEEIKGLIQIHIATIGDDSTSIDSIESQLLLNMDLRSIGGKSLPNDPFLIDKLSNLQGPKVLQVVSSRDISQSSIEALSRSSSSRRLLRLCLTDGYSEIVAIEYSPIPALHEDIVPGTKVRLENKAALHNGIVCLNPKVVTVLGGVVQTLHEEWEMNRKYSGFSRSTLRPTQRSDGDTPPPFEKLQINTRSQKSAQQHITEAVSNNTVPVMKAGASSDFKEIKGKNPNTYPHKKDVDTKEAGLNGQRVEKPSSSESRPKEVSEAVPVQNQAAAQKLLQKMSQPSRSDQHFRGSKQRGRGRGRQEEPAVFTLEEWEKRKDEVRRPTRHDVQDIYNDEELARQLQEQLDLENIQAQTGQESEAEKIRMSMFNFQRMEEDSNRGRSGFRGRGRGRGRGRRRFG